VALKRELRLRKNTDFQRVRQHGRKTASRLLVLMCAPNNLATVRVGFVVSKRISKQAVERNYIRRLLSEAMRPFLLDISAGWDIVVSVKQTIIGMSLPALAQDLYMVLRRAQLFAPPSDGEAQS
jgi:ribonuclease P protein component